MDVEMFFSFLFVCFLYMIYPIIKVFVFKAKLTRKGATILARNNSIIIFLLMLIPSGNEDVPFASIVIIFAFLSLIFFLLNRWLYTNFNMTSKEKVILKKIDEKESELSILNNQEDDELAEEEKEKIKKLGKEIKRLNEDLLKINSNSELENNIKSSKETIEEEKYYCSNCGVEIKESDKYCPKCGESFDEDESNNKEKESISIDQKYDDLIKLKELYDKKIITKEEFEKEKEKIL